MSDREFHMEVLPPGGRLDRYLTGSLQDISRTRVQKLIRQGLVLVDGLVITKTGHALEGGEEVEIFIPAPSPSPLIPEDIPLDILYEDENCILINKPPGMVVHPSTGHDRGTLVHAILGYAPDLVGIGDERRPGVVHRLDKDTSGLIIFAKHDRAHQWLQFQFKDRKVAKTYYAICDGHPPTPDGRIEAGIGRDPKNRQKMAVRPEGKSREALTIFHEVERFQEHALLQLHPVTGRTHQLRVHLAFVGAPVLGDKVYGKRKISLPVPRQMLHAGKLEITLPEQSVPSEFEAPRPKDFDDALSRLRSGG